jgi:hypothetical protein
VNTNSPKGTLWNVATHGPAKDVKLDGNLAYVACGTGGLDVIDVSDPTKPTMVTNYPGVRGAKVVEVNNGYAYVACESAGLAILAINYVGAGLGQAVVEAGTSGSIPINIESWVELTNLAFTVSYPEERLGSFSLNFTSPLVVTNQVFTNSPGLLSINLTIAPGQVPGARKDIGSLNFTALLPQTSAFVDLQVGGLKGTKPDGSAASIGPRTPGHVTIVAEEPLLQIVKESNGSHWLTLYSKPNYTNAILSSPEVTAPISSWTQKYYSDLMTSLTQRIGPVQTTSPKEFFRAYRVVP